MNPRLQVRPGKFQDPEVTATGARRARVDLTTLQTLWFNTGTLCNLACDNCYIHSSPTNDSLVYLSVSEIRDFIDQIATGKHATTEVGFTGGEPFMNPDLTDMLKLCLYRGFSVLVLTNAMKPMMKCSDHLISLNERYSGALNLRVSLDHYSEIQHQILRGQHSWAAALKGLQWLCTNSFQVQVAGRLRWSENESDLRSGYAGLFRKQGLNIDAYNPRQLVLFPEMVDDADVPEISEECWSVLGIHPDQVMCANSRMVVKRKGAPRPTVVPCTLLAENPQLELGHSLEDARQQVTLNHPHCARFCVLGGASCSNN